MTKRYRLIARAQMHGEVREPGYVFTLEEGEQGPHRTVSARPDVNIADHLGQREKLVDEPLYVEISEEHNQALDEAEAKAAEQADAHAEACAARDAEQAKAAEDDKVPLGPTIEEFVAAGYRAENYPPVGYAARSTPDEVQKAIEAQRAAEAEKAKAVEAEKLEAEQAAPKEPQTAAETKPAAE
ncbi:hypothetical protein ACRQ5Q_22305 [Bradyrhizobium sp. PMVTL-01]|uniref:hypothetical protein n=1 Tax=Bradyrhizobium sp. PMVTL-01 TaxID=3434999 RepID=UPI003F6F2FD8